MADTEHPGEERWGTIFMGPTSDREATIDKLTEKQRRELWNRRTEAEYMERVRAKATLRVQAMLEQAKANAEAIRNAAREWVDKTRLETEAVRAQADQIKSEAESLRIQAEKMRENGHEEGYRLGVEQAMMEFDEHRTALEEATSTVLKTIGEQRFALFEAWREDLVALTRDAVETMTGWVLSEERQAILRSLLETSFQQLESRRRVIVRSNPVDSEAVNEVISLVRGRFPDLQSWEVVPDSGIAEGGLVLESDSGVVDNRMELRREAVEKVLRYLVLPPGETEEQASANIESVLEDTGMNTLAAQAEARMAASLPPPEPPEEALPPAEEAAPEALAEGETVAGAEEEPLQLPPEAALTERSEAALPEGAALPESAPSGEPPLEEPFFSIPGPGAPAPQAPPPVALVEPEHPTEFTEEDAIPVLNITVGGFESTAEDEAVPTGPEDLPGVLGLDPKEERKDGA